MVVDEHKVSSFADELSVLTVNRVLARDMNIHEALKALIDAVVYSVGRTMNTEQFEKISEESNPLALSLIENLKMNIDNANVDGEPFNITHVMLSFNTALSYVLANMEE